MRVRAVSRIALTVVLFSLLPLTFKVQPVAADGAVDWWPMFRHDLSHAGYSTSTAPTTNHTIWNYRTGGYVSSSPAVADGRVYIGSDDNKVYCLNANTGVHLWNYTTNNDVHSSPAVADGRVYIGSRDDTVYCLNASTGAHLWNYTTGLSVYSSPAVADGNVYVGSNDGKIYCLNAITGAHIWNYTTGSSVHSSPAVASGKVYVGSYDYAVYCLNASNGIRIWSYTTGYHVTSSPAVAEGRVYLGSNDARVYAFAASVWSANAAGNPKTTFNWVNNVYVRGQGFPVDTNVTTYLMPDGAAALPSNAVADALATTNGTGSFPVTLVWSQPLVLGEYDVWVDVNQNGIFDGEDVWNSQAMGIYMFNVIPEFPTLTSMLLVFTIPIVAMAIYKRTLRAFDNGARVD